MRNSEDGINSSIVQAVQDRAFFARQRILAPGLEIKVDRR